MASPHELIERALSIHGDVIFRAALLLAGDDKGVEPLLYGLVAAMNVASPASPPTEDDLLAHLLALAQARAAKRSLQRQFRPAADLPPLYRSLLSLPLSQRLALGLHLLFGYDAAHLALVIGEDETTARANLLRAMQALAPPAGITLTDVISSEHCLAVRDALMDPAGRLRHAPAIRGHLASCAYCRSFDLAWGELSQATEAALRTVLRDRDMPADLAASLAAKLRPARRFGSNVHFVLPPLAILVIIAVLVLPGMGRRVVIVVDREVTVPADPHALITRALAIYASPPERGGPIWHARYRTFWYFDDSTLAPLHADLWLDRSNPARHRVQLTHTAGGAPYELQLGDGTNRLYYALDSLYARSLYGSFPVNVMNDPPMLLSQAAVPVVQTDALMERITYGAWGVPLFYLHQAQSATDLRVLGRQRDGDRNVQIISYSGTSPMGYPADASDTVERVTVLLALDLDDGRLRSATELAGPTSGIQSSRITWELLSEESYNSSADAGEPFNVDQAWNGRGTFADARSDQSADLAMPLISKMVLADPAQVAGDFGSQIWIPATLPPGIERALLIQPLSDPEVSTLPYAIIYLGLDQRLILRFDAFNVLDGAEQIQRGAWSVALKPERTRSYHATLRYTPSLDNAGSQNPATEAVIQLDAHGLSRAELLAVIDSLRFADAALLTGQDTFFVRPDQSLAAIHMALIDQLHKR